MKRQTDNTTPGGMGLDRMGLVKGLISPPSEPPGEIMSFGLSPVNYSDSDSRAFTREVNIHVMSLEQESGRFFFHFREIFEKCIEYIGKFLIHFREILNFC